MPLLQGVSLDVKRMSMAVSAVLLMGVVMAKVGYAAKHKDAKNGSREEHVECSDGRVASPHAAPTTGNISKAKRERLIAEMGEIRAFLEKSACADTNALRLLQFAAEVEREVRDKKYGLVFEEHRERVDEELLHNVPVLTEVKDRFVDGEKFLTQSCRDAEEGGHQPVVADADARKRVAPLNFLIEGDNLAALKLLEKTHCGAIDLIYIDPPYNTGNKDFVYNDSYVDKTDTFRHSKWLSFMQKRLKIAKRLLKKDGVIFISIDNNEGFHLKLLMDDIFGDEAFAADLHVETSAIAGPRRYAAVNGSVVKTAEFIFGYVNGSNTKIMRHPMYDYIQGFDAHYSLFYDAKHKVFKHFVDVLKQDDATRKAFEQFKLRVSLKNLGKVILVDDKIRTWLYSDAIAGNLYREGEVSSITIDDVEENCQFGEMVCHKESFYRNGGDGTLTTLFRYKDRVGACDDYFSSFGERCIRGNLWKGFSADGGNLAKEGYVPFKKGKKPKRLLMQLIQATSPENCKSSFKVLDFFAGSGTTGHAVMELNKRDGGNRSFILVNNNDEGICEKVTYKRLKRVIERDKYVAAVKYLKVDYIPIDGKVYYDYADELLKHIRELVELENGIDFKTDSTIAIAVTDKEFEKFVANEKNIEGKKAVYVGHDVLIGKPAWQKLERRGIEIRIIPQYYYSEQES